MKASLALIALPLGLSGCDKKPEASKVEAPKAAASTDAMSTMAMPAGSKMGKGSGTVTAIDATAGKITLDHGAIPAVDWPAMTMTFRTKNAAQVRGLKTGDRVRFTFTQQDAGPRIETIGRTGQ